MGAILFAFAVVVELGSESEVAHLDLQVVAQEQVAQFEVPMYHILGMKIDAPVAYLPNKVASFGFRHRASSFVELHHRLHTRKVYS